MKPVLMSIAGTLLLLSSTMVSSAEWLTDDEVRAIIDAYGLNVWTYIIALPRNQRPTWFRKLTEPHGCVRIGGGYDFDDCWYTL